MSEKLKGMLGSKTRFDEVLKWLKSQGAVECDYRGNSESAIYYVDKGEVKMIDKEHSVLFEIVELPRWRAKGCEPYYYVTEAGDVASNYDNAHCSSNVRYEIGNYFKTREEAKLYAEKICEIFKRNKTAE